MSDDRLNAGEARSLEREIDRLGAEVASLRTALQHESEQVTLFRGERDHALANADLMSRTADAWRTIAKARADMLRRPDATSNDEIRARLHAGKDALRALGIDPDERTPADPGGPTEAEMRYANPRSTGAPRMPG